MKKKKELLEKKKKFNLFYLIIILILSGFTFIYFELYLGGYFLGTNMIPEWRVEDNYDDIYDKHYIYTKKFITFEEYKDQFYKELNMMKKTVEKEKDEQKREYLERKIDIFDNYSEDDILEEYYNYRDVYENNLASLVRALGKYLVLAFSIFIPIIFYRLFDIVGGVVAIVIDFVISFFFTINFISLTIIPINHLYIVFYLSIVYVIVNYFVFDKKLEKKS